MFNKKTIVSVIAAASLLLVFWLGIYVGKTQVVCQICPPSDLDFSLFWQALEQLKEKSINSSILSDPKNIVYGAISGMVGALKDPYTVFFNPGDSKKFMADVSGQFEGIGIEIGIRDKNLQVVAPLDGTPADKAGIRAGDEIVKIGGKDTANMPVDQAVDLIRGPKDTEVSLTIFREGWTATKDFKIKRALIEVPSITSHFISSETGKQSDNGDIAYIKIYQFSENLDLDFAKAADKILNSSAKKIILDLRNNPGGYLQRAQDIAGWFLKSGQIVVSEDFGGKQENIVYKAEGNSRLSAYPVVILINGGTASASEILASALRDNNGTRLIGEKSFGKGSVQEVNNLRDGSSLKITVAHWLTPKGELINEIGLKPDIEVVMADKDYTDNKDPQMDKAIEIIKGIK